MADKRDDTMGDPTQSARRRQRFESNPDNESDEAHERAGTSSIPLDVLEGSADVASDLAHERGANAVTAAGRAEALGSNPDLEAEEAERALGGRGASLLDDDDPDGR